MLQKQTQSISIESSDLELNRINEEYILANVTANHDKGNKLTLEMLFRLAKEVKDSGLTLGYQLILLKEFNLTHKLSQKMDLANSTKTLLSVNTLGTDDVGLDVESAIMTAPDAVVKMFKLYDSTLTAGDKINVRARFILDKVKSTLLTINHNAKYDVYLENHAGVPKDIVVVVDSVSEVSLVSYLRISV